MLESNAKLTRKDQKIVYKSFQYKSDWEQWFLTLRQPSPDGSSSDTWNLPPPFGLGTL